MTLAYNSLMVGAALALTVTTSVAQAATWSDTAIGYRYGTQFAEPGNDKDIEKHVLSLTHARGHAYGQHFFNLDMLQSDSNDPANNSDDGALEAYLTLRTQLHNGLLFGNPLAFGPVKDMALTGGVDLNTKNTAFAPRKRLLLLGPTFKFDVPQGFVDLSLLYAKEWNHCGVDICSQDGFTDDITFDSYYQINLVWGVPFELGGTSMKFQGFYNYNGTKGKDYFNDDTAHEQLMRTSLMLDLGGLAWNQENNLWAGVGYEYWRNKFGNPDKKDGVDTDALTFNLEWHF